MQPREGVVGHLTGACYPSHYEIVIMKFIQPAKYLYLMILMAALGPQLMAQPNVQGQWTTMSRTMPINPIHVSLLNNGQVLVVAGSGNNPPNKNLQAAIWNPQTGTTSTQTVSWDMFCNGAVVLPDGRVFINGGTQQYNPFFGLPRTSVFDPVDNTFIDLPPTLHGRWYPTVITLGDGRVMTFSGLNETGSTNSTVEIFASTSGTWSPQYPANFTPPLYPRLHLLPSGKVFYSGSTPRSRYFFPSSHSWSSVIATTNYGGTRTYGSSVLLPLTPANNYKPVVMLLGGGNPATATTETIDLSATTPVWQWGPPMSQPRIEMNAVILPNGKVLAIGGSAQDENASTASYNADLYDPVTNTFSSAGSNAFPRLYHSVALLLPDATIWLAGSNPKRGTYEPHMEIYQPSYLFNPDGSVAVRPAITNAPTTVGWGGNFTVQTPDAATISSVVLVKAGSTTHAFDMDQRLVGLSYVVADSGNLKVTGPPNSNIAPPGYYLLFLLNSAGVPSVASFVQVTAGPDFTITTSPPQQATVPGGTATYTVQLAPSAGYSGTVNLSAINPPTGATATFNPTSISGRGTSALAVNTNGLNPPNFPATFPFTVSATDGTLTRSDTVNLIVNSPGDFSLAASPGSLTITRGGASGQSTITLSPSNGFVGAVNFTVTGSPGPKIIATVSPTSLPGSGTTTLTVLAQTGSVTGNFKLTITGTSGTIVHTTAVNLTVQ